jgi:hypothetical protein
MAAQNLANVVDTISGGFWAFTKRGLGKGGAKRHRKIIPPGAPPLLTFLANPSVVLANLIPDQITGEIKVPFSAFKEGSYLQILATDGPQAVQTSAVIRELWKTQVQKRDLRFKNALDHNKHYIGERIGINLDPKLRKNVGSSSGTTSVTESHSITLVSNGSSSSAVRVINSISQVYDLMMILLGTEAQKQNLRKFGFIVDWYRFSTTTKNEKYSKWNCHELNLFLYKKDKPFFKDVVVPFIKVNRLPPCLLRYNCFGLILFDLKSFPFFFFFVQ